LEKTRKRNNSWELLGIAYSIGLGEKGNLQGETHTKIWIFLKVEGLGQIGTAKSNGKGGPGSKNSTGTGKGGLARARRGGERTRGEGGGAIRRN